MTQSKKGFSNSVTMRQYQLLQRELLTALRGRRSRAQMSRFIGREYNVYQRWESGLTRVSYSDFAEIVQKCKRPLLDAFKAIGVVHDGEELIGRIVETLINCSL